MNKQYQELQVEKDVYIPQPAMAYPEENPFERTLFPKYTKELAIDEHYPYLDDSLGYKLNLLWGYYLVMHVLLRLKLRVQMGLRIQGREVLKRYKKERFKDYAIGSVYFVFRRCPWHRHVLLLKIEERQ